MVGGVDGLGTLSLHVLPRAHRAGAQGPALRIPAREPAQAGAARRRLCGQEPVGGCAAADRWRHAVVAIARHRRLPGCHASRAPPDPGRYAGARARAGTVRRHFLRHPSREQHAHPALFAGRAGRHG
ncbi:hypothetical protein G6F22_020541 [Rhizopus arrhizus]|nr:hypothetical protein G6F22_020541 [Rhizopus arrhizus]